MPAPKNNTNAAKPARERADSILHIRVRRADKARWVRAASPAKLAPWVIASLNAASTSTPKAT